jgi:hypothetical protein
MRIINHKPVQAVLALALVAQLGVAGQAVAATRHKKKSSRTVVKVHCAAVKVRCQGRTGAGGPAGPNGRNGLNGTNGVNGHNGGLVVTRARLAQSPVVASSSGVPLRFGGAHWTQGPNEDDTLIGGFTATAPAQCSSPTVVVRINVDGGNTFATIGFATTTSPNQTVTMGFNFSFPFGLGDIPAAGFGQDHVITGTAYDDCSGSGDGHFSVQSVDVDVAAFS